MNKCTECGARVVESATTCDACRAIDGPFVVGRRGPVLVVSPGASLPSLCVKCGAATLIATPSRFRWHHPVYYVGLVGGLLPYVLLALLFRKQFDLDVPMCRAHRRRRTRVRVLGGLLLVAAVAGTAVTAINVPPGMWVLLVGLVVLDVLLLVGWMTASAGASIRAVEITDRYARFAGACPAFLAALE